MIKVTTTRVTTMITTTMKTIAELDSKMQYFAAMHDCSCLFILMRLLPKATLVKLPISGNVTNPY